VRVFQGLGTTSRRWLGRTVHRHGMALRSDVAHLQAQLERLEAAYARLHSECAETAEARAELFARVATSETATAVEVFGRFIRHTRLRSAPLISVVLPTYNRPDRLRRAVDSVLAQRYPHWELLVVDDGGQFDSRAVVEAAGDDRLRWMRIEHAGAGAARNAALDRASGELIAYLDDDNAMDVDWLHSGAWAFEQHPEVDVLYGAFVIDDVLRLDGKGSGDLPRAYLWPWSREALREHNLADMGAIAHRAGLPEARFDERLQTLGDWDLLVGLTATRDPFVLPAIACYYSTDAPARLTGSPTEADDTARVRARAAVVLK
jgi:hypothetical protein